MVSRNGYLKSDVRNLRRADRSDTSGRRETVGDGHRVDQYVRAVEPPHRGVDNIRAEIHANGVDSRRDAYIGSVSGMDAVLRGAPNGGVRAGPVHAFRIRGRKRDSVARQLARQDGVASRRCPGQGGAEVDSDRHCVGLVRTAKADRKTCQDRSKSTRGVVRSPGGKHHAASLLKKE